MDIYVPTVFDFILDSKFNSLKIFAEKITTFGVVFDLDYRCYNREVRKIT